MPPIAWANSHRGFEDALMALLIRTDCRQQQGVSVPGACSLFSAVTVCTKIDHMRVQTGLFEKFF